MRVNEHTAKQPILVSTGVTSSGNILPSERSDDATKLDYGEAKDDSIHTNQLEEEGKNDYLIIQYNRDKTKI